MWRALVIVVAVLAISPARAAAPARYPARCAKVDPVNIGKMIIAARREAESALDAKDFARYEDWNERKMELVVDQKLWQYLCTDAN